MYPSSNNTLLSFVQYPPHNYHHYDNNNNNNCHTNTSCNKKAMGGQGQGGQGAIFHKPHKPKGKLKGEEVVIPVTLPS